MHSSLRQSRPNSHHYTLLLAWMDVPRAQIFPSLLRLILYLFLPDFFWKPLLKIGRHFCIKVIYSILVTWASLELETATHLRSN